MRSLWMMAFLLVAAPAFGAERAGVKMPDTITVAGKQLVLNGLGVREATIFNVDVYVAGLYLEAKSSNGDQIASSEQVKRINMVFVRDVDRSDIVDAFRDGFKRNGGDMNKLKDRLGKLNGWMTDIKKGQTLSFTYEPGKGTTVELKGEVKGVIEGADFATAVFRNYIGPKPPNSGLKNGLLGK